MSPMERSAPIATPISPPSLHINHVSLSTSTNKRSLYLPIELRSEQTSKPVAITTLIDSGAQGNFISHNFAAKHGYQQIPLPQPIPLGNVDGTKNQHGDITSYIQIDSIIDGRDCKISAF